MKFENNRVEFVDVSALTALVSIRDETESGYLLHKVDLQLISPMCYEQTTTASVMNNVKAYIGSKIQSVHLP